MMIERKTACSGRNRGGESEDWENERKKEAMPNVARDDRQAGYVSVLCVWGIKNDDS